MSERIINLYQKYKKEYEKTGRYRHIVVRYARELKRLGININKKEEQVINKKEEEIEKNQKIIHLYQKYKKEYEKTGKYRDIVVRYGRELKRLGINIDKEKEIQVENNKENINFKGMLNKYDFKVPEIKDNQIRLIYCGTLREEENILEIIEEFKKIHQKKPEVILKIIYEKIHGDQNFKNKINQIIKTGVKGITFKYNLSHRDSCYEIATSDIGICWRKNGELSTKVKDQL